MFIKASTLVLSLVAFVNAAPQHELTIRTSSACDTGPVQCCNELFNSTSGASSILSGLDLLGTLEGFLGVDCTPINIIGLGNGATCEQQPVCCENISSEGVGVNCSPIDLNL